MNKKLILVALALIATAFTSTAFGAACDSGATLQFVAAGSSAQFNTMAYAASDVIAQEGATPFHLFSVKGAETSGFQTAAVQDVRGNGDEQDSATLFVMWDNNATCNVFAYYNMDSTIGNRAYFASQLLKGGAGNAKSFPSAGVLPCLAGQGTEYPSGACTNTGVDLTTSGFCTGKCAQNQVGGLTDTESPDVLPSSVYVALTTPVVPQESATTKPAPYCGQLYAADSTSAFYCYFNAAVTDIRPEDAVYASNRALAAPATGAAGFGYGNSACAPTSQQTGATTCQIYDSFNQGGVFNVLKFNISGKDPYQTGAAVPNYTTLSVGASPVVVIVANSDSSGFGKTYTDSNNKTSYLFNDINRSKLAMIFSGASKCTGDVLAAAAVSSGNANQPGSGFGSGPALQVVHREPLSGTYNTFEFTGVRTLNGSSNAATSKLSSTAWTSFDESGQEVFPQLSSDDTVATVFPWVIDPAFQNFQNSTTSGACGTISTTGGINKVTNPNGDQYCSDPLFISNTYSSSTDSEATDNCASGRYLRLRAIGTGQEVPDALGLNNTGVEQVSDGIGYSFWSYGNLAKATASVGHYLTVDAIDPLFTTEGGYYDRNDGLAAWNVPQCNLNSLPCSTKIPFTHIYDGKYPLWSLLRVVSFANVTSDTQTPPYVLDMIAYDQIEVNNSTRNTADFVPFLTSLANSGTLTAPAWTGNLNLGVFRSHFKQTGGSVAASNGHEACAGNFTGIKLQGGSAKSSVCLVDTGNDVGGEVLTVQDDVDFIHDFAGKSVEGVTLPATYEEYSLHQ